MLLKQPLLKLQKLYHIRNILISKLFWVLFFKTYTPCIKYCTIFICIKYLTIFKVEKKEKLFSHV